MVNGGGYIYKYPVTTAGCNITDPMLYANKNTPVYDPASYDPYEHYRLVMSVIELYAVKCCDNKPLSVYDSMAKHIKLAAV